uniref:Cytochrome c oxidase subunit 2 n=1 Tax=Calliotropis micraulax TaxID=2496602 RepID=A0A6B7FNY4_9VEST|nr:cytochrome c oxidase subunit II [Calliotropis micraulax]
MASWGQLAFQDAASPMMQNIIGFHDHAMMILTLVMSVVTVFFMVFVFSKSLSRYTTDSQKLETFWTLTPAIILVFLAVPSLKLLYLIDDTASPALTIKVIAHQWYWSYQYSDFGALEFDSYMVPLDQMKNGDYRLLEVDNRLVLPTGVHTLALISSADVIHSWAIPSLGVKVDAVPGRVNMTWFFSPLPGVYYGQCSEICGVNHSFMPIVAEFIHPNDFLAWVKEMT